MSDPGVYVFIGPLAGFDYKSRHDITLLSKALNYWTNGGRKEAIEDGFDHLSSDAPEMSLIEPLQKSTVEALAAKMATNSLLREVLEHFMKAPVKDRAAFTKAAREMRKFVPIFDKLSEGEPLSEEWLEARRAWRQKHPLDGSALEPNRHSSPKSVGVLKTRGFLTAAPENTQNGFLLLDSLTSSPPVISALRTSPVVNSASNSDATTSPLVSPKEEPSATAAKSSFQETVSISSDSGSGSGTSLSDPPGSPAVPSTPVQFEFPSIPEIPDARSSATPLKDLQKSANTPSAESEPCPSILITAAPSASDVTIDDELSPAPSLPPNLPTPGLLNTPPPPPPSIHTPAPASTRTTSTRGRGRGKAAGTKRGGKYVGKEHFSQRNAQMSDIIEQAKAREAAREAKMKGEEVSSSVEGGEGMAKDVAGKGNGKRKVGEDSAGEDDWVPEDEEEEEEEIVPAKKRRRVG
jgi:hypothetical protein